MLVLTVSAGIVGGMLSGLLLSTELVAAQAILKRPKVIEAQSFRLLDQEGRARAVFETGPDGAVGLAMAKSGIIRIRFILDANGNAILDLTDEKGKSHATLTVTAAGSPSLSMRDNNNLSEAWLGAVNVPISTAGIAEERPAGSLILMNKDGRVVWRAP